MLRLVRLLCCFLCAFSLTNAIANDMTPSRLDRITAEHKLRVCIWPDYYGISYRAPGSRELVGLDVDLAKELGKELEAEVVFVDSSFSRLIQDVLGNRCDIAAFAIGITNQRAEKLRFTSPHLASDIYAITTQNNQRIRNWDDIDQPGVTVAVARGTLHEMVMRDKLRHARLSVLSSPHAREQEVEAGRADVFMTDYPYSRWMLTTASWARLVSPSGTYHVTPYAWALAPGDERWHKRVDAFIAAVKRDGRLQESARRHGLEPIAVTR
ncbi:transporter substrate-binding domain-containing protein [Azoarcus sp. TTM-91]|nr:transporter substrate-binding domain-containing protein [Azoarcus sp. TTM-91]